MTPAAEYICACGHRLDAHNRPRADREPWGECRQIVGASRCDCSEAWPEEDR